jgi:nicotinamidase-related amidase
MTPSAPPALSPDRCALIAIDCLNTFIRPEGALSISRYQGQACGLDPVASQRSLDAMAARMGHLRRALFEARVPQVQLQDAHVVEWVHGRRFHSMEIAREGEAPDYVRTFPPHALLDRDRRFGTADQQAIDELRLPLRQVLVRWFDPAYPPEADLCADRELIFLKDDFCASPGTPFTDRLFWELRRQRRFTLIVMGVCDEICNLRNALLMLSSLFHVLYVEDCTAPLDPQKREGALRYLSEFNPLGQASAGQLERVTAAEVVARLGVGR